MLNSDPAKPDIIELTDADLVATNGGNCVGDFFRAIGGPIEHAVEWAGHEIFGGLQGPGNLRGPFGPGPGVPPS